MRNFGANHVFDQLAPYAATDFRSIGHKVIYLSNAFRTLRTIGWEYAEPVMRSLVYAMLNHHGEPNPAESDLAADRAGTRQPRIDRIDLRSIGEAGRKMTARPANWSRRCTNVRRRKPARRSSQLLDAGVAVQSLWDGLFASAGELDDAQRGIVALHSVTTTNAIHHAFRVAGDDQTRQYVLLQNASFLPMFREAAGDRGKARGPSH